jgi:methylase of polypeptide subunit release factors
VSNLALFDLEEPEPTEGRDPLDRYYTPEWATQALVDYLGERLVGDVWDPCCGKDWGGRVLRKASGVEKFWGSDIDPDAVCVHDDENGYREFSDTSRDFMTTAFQFTPNWIITNPPYRSGELTATDFVRRARGYGCSVAMLLRLTWLEPCADRIDILIKNPPTDVLILPRVNFIGAPGSNPCTSAWVIWDRFNRGHGTKTAWHRRDR